MGYIKNFATKTLALSMCVTVSLSSVGTGWYSSYKAYAAVRNSFVINEKEVRGAAETTETLSFKDQTSSAITFGGAEDWDNTLSVVFEGDGKEVAAGSELSFKMTISEKAYKTMGEKDYIKLEADFFQADNNWDTLVKSGWPEFKPADFKNNGNETYSVEVKMPSLDTDVAVFYSLNIRGVGTGFKGEVTFSDVKLTKAIKVEQYVEITEKVKDKADIADLSGMAKSVKLADADATDSTKAMAAYLMGLQKSGQVLFGHQNSTFRSVRDDGKTSDVKDITGSEAGLFGIDTLALAGMETGKTTRQEAIDTSVAAAIKAYEGGSLISLSCHMPNFTNSKITKTGDEKYPYDFTKCDFTESQDVTPCADYILEGGEYNPQFNAYLDIIADFAKALQDKNIPVLFRPFHENSGSWFWWGSSTSVESYQAMWRYTVNYLEDKGVHNFLYVYSPNGPVASETDYLERYPGDAYVDVLGFDYYDDYSDVSKYTGDAFFEALAKSCDVVAGLAEKKNKIPTIAEAGVRVTGAGRDSLIVSKNPIKDHDWYNKIVNTASEHKIPYFLLWANFGEGNFFIPYKTSDTQGQELINEFISSYNNEKSIFGNGTNFYGENGAISKASEVALNGYSSETNGYMISPKNYAVIKEACDLKAYIKNVKEKVEFEIKTSESSEAVIIAAVKDDNSNIYTANLSKEVLDSLGKTSTGIVTLIADGQELGKAKFINFNKDMDVLSKGMFDNFEYYYGDNSLFQSKYGTHNSAADCNSSVSLNSAEKAEGDYSCAFNYSLSYKGSEVWTGGLGRAFDTDKTDLSEYNAISMWVKPDGNGQKMVFQVNGDYEVYLSDFVKGTKAQYVTIPFTSLIKKGGTESIDAGNITEFKLWCNSLPENYTGQKDENGNYTVSGTILFDDIRAVKISDADLAKADKNGLIISDKVLSNTPSNDKPATTDKITSNKTNATMVKDVASKNASIYTGVSDTDSKNSVDVKIPANYLQSAKDSKIKEVDIYIEKATVDAAKANKGKNMVINIKVPAVDGVSVGKVMLTKDSMASAAKASKKLVVKIENAATSKSYTMTIPQRSIKKMKGNTDITVNAGKITGMDKNSQKKVKKILSSNGIKASNAYVVSISENNIKNDIKVTVPVLIPSAKAGSIVYVYRYNSKSGKLEEIANNRKTISKGKTISIEGYSGNDYVITNKWFPTRNVK